MKLSELQHNIKQHDFNLGDKSGYFLKLVEEVGELSQAIRTQQFGQPDAQNLKGSVAEELHDILYYVCALANVHEIDLQQTCHLKEQLNKIKYAR